MNKTRGEIEKNDGRCAHIIHRCFYGSMIFKFTSLAHIKKCMFVNDMCGYARMG